MITRKQFSVASSILTAFVLMLSVSQGLDFSDMGYSLSKYRFVFEPACGTFSAGLALSEIVGGVVGLLSGWGSVLVFKLAFAVLTLLTAGLAVRLLKIKLTGSIMGGMLLAILIAGFDMQWIGYYNLTAVSLLAVAGAVCLSVWKRSLVWLGVAFFLTVMAGCVRLPNLLIVVLPGVAVFRLGRFFPVIRVLLHAMAGGGLAIGLALAVLVASGQFESFVSQMSGVAATAAGSGSYGVGTLIRKLGGELLRSVGLALLMLAGWYAAGRISSAWFRVVAIGLPHVVTVVAYIGLSLDGSVVNLEFYPVYHLVALVMATFIAGWHHVRAEARFLALLSCVVMVVSALGSMRALTVMLYGFWLAVPLAQYFGMAALRRRYGVGALARWIASSVFIPAVCMGLFFAWTHNFRESPHRHRLTCSMQDRALTGLCTTGERASAVDRLMWKLRSVEKDYASLLQCNDLPLVHFLVGLPPYAGIIWYLSHEEHDLARRLEKGLSGGLPLVVRHTAPGEDRSWPARDADGGRAVRKRKGSQSNRQLLLDFCVQHEYEVTWTDGYFEVLEPRRMARKRSILQSIRD